MATKGDKPQAAILLAASESKACLTVKKKKKKKLISLKLVQHTFSLFYGSDRSPHLPTDTSGLQNLILVWFLMYSKYVLPVGTIQR